MLPSDMKIFQVWQIHFNTMDGEGRQTQAGQQPPWAPESSYKGASGLFIPLIQL